MFLRKSVLFEISELELINNRGSWVTHTSNVGARSQENSIGGKKVTTCSLTPNHIFSKQTPFHLQLELCEVKMFKNS